MAVGCNDAAGDIRTAPQFRDAIGHSTDINRVGFLQLKKERTKMCECKGYLTTSKMLMMALLSVVCLTGCHGGIGWDRLQAPVGFPNKGDLDQSRQVGLVPGDAGRPAEHNA